MSRHPKRMGYGPPTKVPPCTSWWTSAARDGFTQTCRDELSRYLQSPMAYRRLSLEGEWWGLPKAKKPTKRAYSEEEHAA